MRRLPIVLLVAFAASFELTAQEYMPDDPFAAGLRRCYVQAGRAFPITSFPASRRALISAAELLLAEGGDAEAIATLLDSAGAPPAEGAKALAGVEAALVYAPASGARTLEDVSTGSTENDGVDARRLHFDQLPFLRLGGTIEGSYGLSLSIEGELKHEWTGDYSKADNLPISGTKSNPLPLENHMFTQGVAAWQGEGLRIAIGRDRVHLGAGPGSTFLHSKILPYLDAATATATLGRWNLDWIVSTISASKNYTLDVDSEAPNEFGPTGHYGFENDPGDISTHSAVLSTIFYNIHRIQWSGDRLRAALAGQMLVARRDNMFEISDFLPVATWHNSDVMPNNLSIVMDASWAIAKGLTLHAQAAYDDISADIFGVGDNNIPTIDAYLLDAEFAFDSARIAFSGYAEGGYTHYLWGNFDNQTVPEEDRNLLARSIGRYKADNVGAILLPLTSPYGPGALWFQAHLGAIPAGLPLEFGADILVLSKNTKANLITTPYEADAAVAKAPRSLAIEAKLRAEARLGSATFGIEPGILVREKDLSVSLGMGARYSIGRLDND